MCKNNDQYLLLPIKIFNEKDDAKRLLQDQNLVFFQDQGQNQNFSVQS